MLVRQKLNQIRCIALTAIIAVSLVVQIFGFAIVAQAEDTPIAETTAPLVEAPPEPTPTPEVIVTEPVAVPSDPVTTTPVDTPQPIAVEQPAPTAAVAPGPQSPTGASAPSYTYNESTGLWESEKYTWNPITKQTTPKVPTNYSYNPDSGRWDTTEWVYAPESGKYVANTISVAPQAISKIISDPTSPASIQALIDAGFTPDEAIALAKYIEDGGPNSNNTVLSDSSKKHTFDMFYNVFISNNIDSIAKSGDAEVSHNTKGGNAATGNAEAIANIINAIGSSWGFLSGSPLFFVSNIVGNVVGDLLFDPGTGGNNKVSNTDETKIDINYEANNRIDNTVNLEAQSGNALVDSNTGAGNATTGDALALANVVNLINSSIGTGQSFLGMINIQGNLNGDILLPQQNLTNLLNGTVQPVATLTINESNNTELVADLTNNQTINNQVTANAQTGQAAVTKNTTAGNALTGNAETTVNIFNLTGRNIIGSNALFVFVNVMGTWTGLIVDAPAGTTSGAYGSGITQNNALLATNTTANIDATTNNQINNTINVAATSGDATVSNNTRAGNAQTGNARAGVNLLNINNSAFSLSEWFGILFINVLGNWYGSFGVNTDAGNTITITPTPGGSGGSSLKFASNSSPSSQVFAQTRQSGATSGLNRVNAVAETPPLAPIVAVKDSGGGGGPVTAVKGSTQNSFPWAWILLSILAIIIFAYGDKIVDRYNQFRLRATT